MTDGGEAEFKVAELVMAAACVAAATALTTYAYALVPHPKLYIPSTLNIDLILWNTQLIVCAQNVKSWFKLGFPRDGTSRDKPGRDVPLSLCPGTKKFCLSRCPFVPGQGQEQMSRDKLLCPGPSRDKTI